MLPAVGLSGSARLLVVGQWPAPFSLRVSKTSRHRARPYKDTPSAARTSRLTVWPIQWSPAQSLLSATTPREERRLFVSLPALTK